MTEPSPALMGNDPSSHGSPEAWPLATNTLISNLHLQNILTFLWVRTWGTNTAQTGNRDGSEEENDSKGGEGQLGLGWLLLSPRSAPWPHPSQQTHWVHTLWDAPSHHKTF